jgi:RNA polymerase sigma-70 factor (ECF subfamily)
VRDIVDMLKARSRRVLPQDVSPSVAPGPPATAPRSDILWLEPYPDALLPAVPGPEQAVRLREGIRLAFVRVVQALPPRQRAALILHDVLDWNVAEVAVILETTEAAINSVLQRARAAIARPREEPIALAPHHAEVVDRFVHAWESGDFDDFVKLLATDAVLSMPPWEYWLDGKDAVVATMRSSATWDGEPRPGRYRIVPAPMNGEPGGLAVCPRTRWSVPLCLPHRPVARCRRSCRRAHDVRAAGAVRGMGLPAGARRVERLAPSSWLEPRGLQSREATVPAKTRSASAPCVSCAMT